MAGIRSIELSFLSFLYIHVFCYLYLIFSLIIGYFLYMVVVGRGGISSSPGGRYLWIFDDSEIFLSPDCS